MPITSPIFVRGDDLYVFTSVEAAVSFLEPVDVEPDERGWDAEGRLLDVRVEGDVKRGRVSIDQSGARVRLVLAEEVPGHAEELRAVLGEWLARADGTPVPADSSLPELVERARRHAVGFEPPGRTRAIASVIVALAALALWIGWLLLR